MTRESIERELQIEAQKNDWVVVTDKGQIWGSEASYSSIKGGGGKKYIIMASEIRYGHKDFVIEGRAYDLEEIVDYVKEQRELYK